MLDKGLPDSVTLMDYTSFQSKMNYISMRLSQAPGGTSYSSSISRKRICSDNAVIRKFLDSIKSEQLYAQKFEIPKVLMNTLEESYRILQQYEN